MLRTIIAVVIEFVGIIAVVRRGEIVVDLDFVCVRELVVAETVGLFPRPSVGFILPGFSLSVRGMRRKRENLTEILRGIGISAVVRHIIFVEDSEIPFLRVAATLTRPLLVTFALGNFELPVAALARIC